MGCAHWMKGSVVEETEALLIFFSSASQGHRQTRKLDVYMVDTPKGSNNEEQRDTAKDNSLKKQPKRQRKRRSKSHLDIDSTHTDQP